MSPEEFILKQKRIIAELNASNALGIAAADTHAKVVERIFEKGKKADGSDIGKYNSSNELYVNPKKAPRKFPPKGKYGDTKFQDGKPHVTGYFDSYKSFRESQGRPSDNVNLFLSGILQSDYSNSLSKVDENTYVVKPKNVRSAEIISLATDKYGNIFGLNESERENFREVFNFEFKRIMGNA